MTPSGAADPGPASACVRRLAAGIVGVITPVGWTTLAATVLVIAVGYAAGWQEFRIIGMALSLVCGCAALLVAGRSRFSVRLEVESERTCVGRPVEGRLVFENGRRPRWGTRLQVMVGDDAVFPSPPARGSGPGSSSAFTVPADRRGVVRVGPVSSVRGDPIGLFRRTVDGTESVDVRVHPPTVHVPSASVGVVRDLEGSPTRDLSSSDISFHTLREYRPGDERRHIHWKSTARSGALMVRQFEETRRSHLVIAFGLSTAEFASEDEFELAVSAASSLAVRAIRDGRELTVLTSPSRAGGPPARFPSVLPATSPQRLLDAVSGLSFGDSDVGVGGLSGIAASAVDGPSLVYLLVGSTPSVRELRSWTLRLRPGAVVVVVVCATGRLPALRRVAELDVVTIGYLDDLRRSLARLAV